MDLKIVHQPPKTFAVSVMIAEQLARFHASSFFMVNEKKINLLNFNGRNYENSDADRLKVLNHNDFHNKNVLFKEVEGKIVDLYFIDFQLCTFASPAIDLIFALYHFVSSENREKHRDEFISIYHHQFVKTLNDFNYCGDLPTLKAFHDEIFKCGTFEVLVAICLTIFYYFDMSQLKDEDLDMGEGTKNARIRMCRTEKYLKMLEWQLKELKEKGVL
ncbi:hypothetical protein PVAND_014857 [Polypedilum vanderplanki]|uniref:CHK kinase-like domain-containing protein n=1 Tax=Polypedilum vanderplanki TaxID=319348 RepID=A0A9J6BAY9_POLVA|nr:hypothetical protein PVAND_014857 [Polypedilum vanderplanki]